MTNKPRVAFQGEHGSFSEDAALKLLGTEIQLVPRPTFSSLFTSLHEDAADYILTPIENSLIGSIKPAAELLAKSSLHVCGEVTIPVAQQLIGCHGATFEGLELVESHPAALAQCRKFFASYPQLQAISTDDTAGSVSRIVARADPTHAAIAGKRAAEIYGGTILRANIQDSPENQTRFLLLAGETTPAVII